MLVCFVIRLFDCVQGGVARLFVSLMGRVLLLFVVAALSVLVTVVASDRFAPSTARCDVCAAVAHELYKAFSAWHNRFHGGSFAPRLGAVLFNDAVDYGCSFESIRNTYKMKTLDDSGEKHLSGPGLKWHTAAGTVPDGDVMGANWVVTGCGDIQEEVGEDELYEDFVEHARDGDNDEGFFRALCIGRVHRCAKSQVDVFVAQRMQKAHQASPDSPIATEL
jgi:hypothetical protein